MVWSEAASEWAKQIGKPPGKPDCRLARPALQKPFGGAALAGKVREILDEGRGRGSVLVVNGEALFRALLGQILSGADVAILDLAMPGQYRMQTLAAIRMQLARVPAIVIGVLGTDRARRAALLSVREALEKPVAPRDLVRAVREALCGGLARS